MNYRDMTDEQRLEWGHAESEARKEDLKDRTPGGLYYAQLAAKGRRLKIGASEVQAARMVIEANREKRRGTA